MQRCRRFELRAEWSIVGPLNGLRVIELAGIGPCPMAGMLLADMGAEVVCIARTAERPPELAIDVSLRGKKSLILDLKKPEGAAALLRLIDKSDVLIEGYRPGVAERLGVGPEVCLS